MKESLSLLRNYNKARHLTLGFENAYARTTACGMRTAETRLRRHPPWSAFPESACWNTN